MNKLHLLFIQNLLSLNGFLVLLYFPNQSCVHGALQRVTALGLGGYDKSVEFHDGFVLLPNMKQTNKFNSPEIYRIKFKMVDEATKKTVASIPMLKTKAGPRDSDAWVQRLKEEYTSLIKYVSNNKEADNDWFRLESNKEGTRWFGKCWHIHNLLKYEFDIEFDIPITYPTTAPEIAIPELDGKTAKMYRGGKICLTDHFKPLWARNVPKFGIAHAMALGLGPWLAVEIPDLINKGLVHYKEKTASE